MRLTALAWLVAGALSANASAAEPADMNNDPHLWLEDVEGEKALDWVRARNAVSEKQLAGDPGFEALRTSLLEVLDSNARIPYVGKMGDYYYNFWRDKQNPQGVWRRTTLAEYRKDAPQWEVLLDIDALGKAEGENWVWHGADCLRPDYSRCLIALSRGGADADGALEQRYWLAHGFVDIDKCLLQALLERKVGCLKLFLSDVATTD